MPSFPEIENKSIALVVFNKEKENDAHVYLGKIMLQDESIVFINEAKKWSIELDEEMMDDIEVVSPALKGMLLGADYWFRMYLSGTIEDDAINDHIATGLKWHESTDES